MIGDIMNISRLRMASDGQGVSTLVAFFGCPLHCKYCINEHCQDKDDSLLETERGAYTPEELKEKLQVDDIYFKMTGGGVVFGGGEPLLQAEFIHEVCGKCDPMWKKRIETSLYSPWYKIEMLLADIDEWIIDVKDVLPTTYEKYTGRSNGIVLHNWEHLLKKVPSKSIRVRVPHIAGYNDHFDVEFSIGYLKDMGVVNIDEFEYIQTKPFCENDSKMELEEEMLLDNEWD